MKKIYVSLLLLTGLFIVFSADTAFAQIKIGKNGATIAPSSLLELESDSQGLLLPRMADTVAINALAPPNGMLIYLTKAPAVGLYVRKNTGWEFLTGSLGSLGDGNVVHKTGAETIEGPKTIDTLMSFKNNTYPQVRGLEILNVGIIPELPTNGIDIPNRLYRWGYETVLSTNEVLGLPKNANSTAFDHDFPVNIMEWGYEGISTHQFQYPDSILAVNAKDFMFWNNRTGRIRSLAPVNLPGSWFQLHVPIYSEAYDGDGHSTWNENVADTAPFQYYRKQSATFTNPAFIYEGSGDGTRGIQNVWRRNRNHIKNPLPVNDSDWVMNLTAQVAKGNFLWGDVGAIKFKAGGASSLTSSGGTFHVEVTPENSLIPVERIYVDKAGTTGINGNFQVNGNIVIPGSFTTGSNVLASGISLNMTTTNSNHTFTTNGYGVAVDASLGARTVNLPTAAGIAGKIFFIKKVDSSLNTVTIYPAGSETIDGATTRVINAQWAGIQIISSGVNWYVIN